MAGSSVIQQILGVRGQDLPTRRANVVTPANFAIGGLMGHFQRRYNAVIPISSPSQFAVTFGGYFNPAYYGPDVVNDFFNNLAGQSGQLYIGAYVGNTAGTINAIVAGLVLLDQQAVPAACVSIQAGYNGIGAPTGGLLQYGVDGNNTGVTVVTGTRFGTTETVAQIAAPTGRTATTVINTNQLTVISGAAPSAAWVGFLVTGAGIPALTYITAVNPG